MFDHQNVSSISFGVTRNNGRGENWGKKSKKNFKLLGFKKRVKIPRVLEITKIRGQKKRILTVF